MSIVFTSFKHPKLSISIKIPVTLLQIVYTVSHVGPQNAPLHNMLLLVAYCVPCIHNMLRWSILCTLHTQYATSGAYCVGSVHMLLQWSSEDTQYALLENMSRGMFAFISLLSSRHPSVYLTSLMCKAMPAS